MADLLITQQTSIAAAAIADRGGAPVALRAALGLDAPAGPGIATDGAALLVWTGPGQWLALRRGLVGTARYAFARSLTDSLGEAASVTEMTGSRAIFRLEGTRARGALAKIVPVDLDDGVFPPGSAAVTNGGYMPVALWRLADCFEIACYRSYGESLRETLQAASAGFGQWVKA